MNEKLKKFQEQIKDMTDEEKEQQMKKFKEAINSIPNFDYEKSMKSLAKIRGKDENHYLTEDEIEFEVQGIYESMVNEAIYEVEELK